MRVSLSRRAMPGASVLCSARRGGLLCSGAATIQRGSCLACGDGSVWLQLHACRGTGQAAEPPDQAGAAGDAEAAPYRLLGAPYHPVSKRVPADYAALLCVCAAYLWVKPDFLHVLVCALEMSMAEAESLVEPHAVNS